MKCSQPTVFPNSKGMKVPCGQCMPCRINRQREIVTKAYLEAMNYPESVTFVTLTYAPEFLPDADKYPGGNLKVSDAQKFMKRLRKNNKDRKIRYLYVGEYGERSQRAHYHVILYGLPWEIADREVKKAWKLGLSVVKPIDYSTSEGNNYLRYTVGYTLKKMTSEREFPDGRNPEFAYWSRKPALGSQAIDIIASYLVKHNLYPSGALSGDERYVFERIMQRGGLKPWPGFVIVSGKVLKLDRRMQRYLFDAMFPQMLDGVVELTDDLDPLRWRQARSYFERRKHDSDIIEVVPDKEGVDMHVKRTIDAKKAAKQKRQYAKGRKI